MNLFFVEKKENSKTYLNNFFAMNEKSYHIKFKTKKFDSIIVYTSKNHIFLIFKRMDENLIFVHLKNVNFFSKIFICIVKKNTFKRIYALNMIFVDIFQKMIWWYVFYYNIFSNHQSWFTCFFFISRNNFNFILRSETKIKFDYFLIEKFTYHWYYG